MSRKRRSSFVKKMSSKVFSMKARLPRRGRRSWATCSSDNVAPSFATVAVARSWANFRKSFVTTRFRPPNQGLEEVADRRGAGEEIERGVEIELGERLPDPRQELVLAAHVP